MARILHLRAPMTTTPRITGTALTDREAIDWALAEERLSTPNEGGTYWLATVRADGAPHVMPLIGAWADDALYFITGEGTQKGHNLAHDPRCVIAVSSTRELPSMDLIVEGRAEHLTEPEQLRHVVEVFDKRFNWPLEVTGSGVSGENAPTAGPPPYAAFRVRPSKIFALPGTVGMEKLKPHELPAPTRWDFDG